MKSSHCLPSLKRVRTEKSIHTETIKSSKYFMEQASKNISIGVHPFEQLHLKWSNEQDMHELKYLLQDILNYPSIDLSNLHRDSNRLGTLDIHENQNLFMKMLYQENQDQIICQCCGFLLQSEEVPLNTPLKNISNLGISTHLFFQTLINISILILVLFVVYGVFGMITNIISYNKFKEREIIKSSINFLIISLSSKKLNRTNENQNFDYIQCWLGFAVVVIWCSIFVLFKYFQKNNVIIIEQRTVSASDFTVVVEGIPTAMTKQQFQDQLDKYYENLTLDQRLKQIDRPFKIAKYNVAVPFYLTMDSIIDSQLKKYIKQKNVLRSKFTKWVEERSQKQTFSTEKTLRIENYNKFRILQQKIQNKYKVACEQIAQQMKLLLDEHPTTTAFVTFESNYAKQLLLHLNCTRDAVIKIKNNIICCKNSEVFTLKHNGKKFMAKIRKAPQPEELIWTNIGQSFEQMIQRKLLTFFVTAVVLGIGFVVVFFLSQEQVDRIQDSLFSFLISLSISVINLFIPQIIRILTSLERQTTQTNFQTSFALKSIFAQLINSIVLPFVVNYLIENNLYNSDGLAYDVFTMGITNAFLLPFLKVLNFEYFLSRGLALFYKIPKNKLQVSQQELNKINELINFEIGNQYIYPINIFLFVSFYVSLQPIICVFGFVGVILMYWVQKYVLFRRCSRPYPGNEMTHQAMEQVMYFGPFVFTLGNIFWSNLIDKQLQKDSMFPNFISLNLSLVFALFPLNYMFSKIMSNQYGEQMHYEEKRIFLPSEYDRTNPATAKQAMKQYYDFLVKYREQIKSLSHEAMKSIEKILLKQKQKGNSQVPSVLKILTQMEVEDQKQPKQLDNWMQIQNNIIKPKQESQTPPFNYKNMRKSATARSLFKSLNLGQRNVINFLQNWQVSPKTGLQITNQGILKNGLIQSKFISHNKKNQIFPEDPQSIHTNDMKKVHISSNLADANRTSVVRFKTFEKSDQETHKLTYDILKNIFAKHQQKCLNRQKCYESNIDETQGNLKKEPPQQQNSANDFGSTAQNNKD